MAELGRREVVSDPLALNPREKGADRSLPTYGVRNPQLSAGNAASKQGMQALGAIDGLMAIATKVFDQRADEAQTEGKIGWMQGKTQDEISKSGGQYGERGWQTMESVNSAQGWYAQELDFVTNGDGRTMDAGTYRKHLMESQKKALKSLNSNDPVVRKAWASAFDGFAPRLAGSQVEAHNQYNKDRAYTGFQNMLMGGVDTNSDASVPTQDGNFRISQQRVAEPVDSTDNDRDIGIRTMLGEAGGEGAEGLAAVAHVIINRSRDPRWPSSIQGVALQDKQFSAWNNGPGGNNPLKYDSNSAAYKRAGEIYDAVVSGHHVDPTGGAVYYYSPKGMDALVAEGSQSNSVPSWLEAAKAESGGTLRIGNHIFAGKSAGSRATGGGAMTRDAYGRPTATAGADVADGAKGAEAYAAPDAVQSAYSGGSQIQRQIMNSPLDPVSKSKALGKAIVLKLDAGDDNLLNDSGGIATMVALGADQADIDAVYKAKQRFDEKKDKEYDGNFERSRADVLARVTNGELDSPEKIQEALDEFHNQYKGTEAEAKSLARQAYAEFARADKDTVIPLELRNLGASLYDKLQSGLITPEEAGQGLIDFGNRNPGIKKSVIDSYVGKMYDLKQQMINQDRAKMETELDKMTKEKEVINRASGALVRGSGLKGLGGTVRIPDEDNPGKTKEVSGEEYGVYALQKNVKDTLQQAVADGRMTPEQAAVEYNKTVYENLADQGVYDKQFGRQVTAAVSGDLIDKDGKPTDAALHALDWYMQLRDNPKVGGAYLAGTIEDDATRTLLETAAQMYDGRADFATAITRANTILNANPDALTDIRKATEVETNVGLKASQTVGEMLDRGNWMSRLINGQDWDADRLTKMATGNMEKLSSWVADRSKTYQLQNTKEPINVSVAKARDDLARNSIVMGDSVIIGDERKGTRLDQVMGLEGYDRTAPNDALSEYLNSGAGSTHWGELWDKQTGYRMGKNSDGSLPMLLFHKNQPRVQATYNPEFKMIEVQLYKQDGSDETVPFKPMMLDPKVLGDRFKKVKGLDNGGYIARTTRAVVDDFATASQNRDAVQGAADAGATMGSMFKPKQ
ncbi:cell wall hydrolase SleB-like protein [Rhizobium phage RHph_I40]|uniref:Cell wall hydrolase SleB-like protein n=1 Tax=Rhizobium phage RHph_I38 TaxID=2509734 RepID=A0A7S5R8T1_9CAUD|nr:cell wall hydrolase SleB-like protein [Rhizobium phage RHph_I38]QXV73670.1 cell wall hydrolase SleB-like protein [Rhizobium phage RHph_I40]